jgi:hypothetical protein
MRVLHGMNYRNQIGNKTTATRLQQEVDQGKSRFRTPASDFVKKSEMTVITANVTLPFYVKYSFITSVYLVYILEVT